MGQADGALPLAVGYEADGGHVQPSRSGRRPGPRWPRPRRRDCAGGRRWRSPAAGPATQMGKELDVAVGPSQGRDHDAHHGRSGGLESGNHVLQARRHTSGSRMIPRPRDT